MLKRITTIGLLILAAIVVTILILRERMGAAVLRDIPLKSIPAISHEVLAAQGNSVRVEDPVTCLREKDTYWFSVEVLPSSRFPEPQTYEFAGDAERLRHFVHEIAFVNESHNGAATRTTEFAAGAKEDVEGLVKSLVGLVFHPLDAAKAGWAGGEAGMTYLKEVYGGKKDAVADLKEFAAAYVENARMKNAAKFGLNFEELQTPQARADIARLAWANVSGAGVAELATLLIGWTKAGKVAKAAEAAATAGKVAAEADRVAQAGQALTKVGRAAAIFETAAEAERGAARAGRFAKTAEVMSNLEKLANLLDPLKVSTLKGTRALNSRLHKVLYWLRQEELAGHNPAEALWRAMKTAKADAPNLPSMLNGSIDHAQIMKNYNLAKELRVFDQAVNLDLMRRGQSPLINAPWGVEKLEVDHIVPVAQAPELSNAWGNLAYQTKKFNRMRGDRFIPAMGDKLVEYRDAGMLPQKRVDEVLIKNIGLKTGS